MGTLTIGFPTMDIGPRPEAWRPGLMWLGGSSPVITTAFGALGPN